MSKVTQIFCCCQYDFGLQVDNMDMVAFRADEELGEQASCCICLENFVDGESLVILLPCPGRHAFHPQVNTGPLHSLCAVRKFVVEYLLCVPCCVSWLLFGSSVH